MQSSTASSAAASTEPLFATVTFIAEDNAHGNTFRVPIGASTTVRRLAKDAMQRLVLSRRNLKGCSDMSAIVVTEVFVGGTGTQPKAEVFAQDCVTQVVLVKEEVVYMRLKAMNTSAAPTQLSSPPPPPHQTGESSTACGGIVACSNPPTTPPTAAAPLFPKEAAPSKDGSESTTVTHSALKTTVLPPAAVKQATTQKSTSDGTAAAAVPSTVEPVVPKAEAPTHRLGWGPEAYGLLPDKHMSAPGKRPRTVQPEPSTTTAQTEKWSKTELSTITVATTRMRDGEELLGKQALEAKRLGWGPEASKHFADNYVSSPDKIARLQRAQRQAVKTSEKSAAPAPTARLTKPVLKAPVSRALQFPMANAEESRTTVGHTVDDAISVDETSPTVELPKGWGRESLKFFDPNTYCDDPTKARLLPNTDYSRSRRHRRPSTL
uniref:Uncharacterized protein n=1 Tax=Leishmania guyanensis TaxID=5670 RepID=A0A1E1J2C8_LEIGU|nr:hypothetical protein, conserved [Leishmania guyanensis]